ncbi:hypothetical protein [Allohahella marinimesophila]|uniref:LPP20 lipoprotein n=1 Tax=Allohahella marinimesophila TaxID=1054972 RepID=A0ABP7NJK0_9GAMM
MNTSSNFKKLALIVSVSTLAACASQQQVPEAPVAQQSSLPDWVMMPVVENGIADTQCVASKPGIGLNYLKSTATSLARAELAKQIDIKVKAMDKTYQRMADTNEGLSVGSSFESVSKQVTEKNLAGSRAIKMDYVTMADNTQNFCVMMAMSPEVTKALFKDLVEASGNQSLSPQNEAVLYERFLAEKAAKELDAEFENSN